MTKLLDYILNEHLVFSLTRDDVMPQSLFDGIHKINDVLKISETDNFIYDYHPGHYTWYVKINGKWRVRVIDRVTHIITFDFNRQFVKI